MIVTGEDGQQFIRLDELATSDLTPDQKIEALALALTGISTLLTGLGTVVGVSRNADSPVMVADDGMVMVPVPDWIPRDQ